MSDLPYTEVEFYDTPVDQLDKWRVEETIRQGFRALPSDVELLSWARHQYGDGLSAQVRVLGEALALGVYLDFYPQIETVDVSRNGTELVSYLSMEHCDRAHIPAGSLLAYVGPDTEAHGFNLIRGMWLAMNEPRIVKAIMRDDNNPNSVDAWWNWRPPTN